MIWIIKGFNDQKGRFNRFKFWVHTLVMQIIAIILFFIISALWSVLNIELLSQIGSFGLAAAMLYIMFTSYIKRLHDLDKSWWMSLLIFIPFINIWLLIYCGFFKWTEWTNKYGPDPLGWNSTESNSNWTPNEL